MAMAIWSSMLGAIFECDEIEMHPISSEETEIKIVTSGYNPDLVKIKSMMFKLFAPPFKLYDVTTVEEVQKGFIMKRYIVSGKVKHSRGIGGRQALMDRIHRFRRR